MKRRNKTQSGAIMRIARSVRGIRTTLSVLLFCMIAPVLCAQVPVALSPVARQQFFLPNGTPNANGCIFTYAAGTSTPASTYTDYSGLYQNSNPIILDGGGFATIYLSNQAYKFVMFTNGGVNCATGSQVWAQDQVNAYSPINNIGTITFTGLAADPTGSAGQIYYNTALGRFRVFNSTWDTIPTDASVDPLTNKTFNIAANTLNNGSSNIAGHYPRNNGTQYVDGGIQPQDVTGASYTAPYANCPSLGTVQGEFVTVSNAAGTLCYITANVGQTSGVVGICISSCGSSGTPVIQYAGISGCNFDNTTVAADYAIISQIEPGQCHDAGSTPPIGIQSVGRISTSTASSGFTVNLLLGSFGSVSNPTVVYSVPTANVIGSVGSTFILTPAVTATYRIGGYATEQAVGVACSGTPTITYYVSFQDPNASAPASSQIGAFVITGVGTLGTIPLSVAAAPGILTFRAKAGTAINYSTIYSGLGGCSTNPTYQLFPILEQLTQN